MLLVVSFCGIDLPALVCSGVMFLGRAAKKAFLVGLLSNFGNRLSSRAGSTCCIFLSSSLFSSGKKDASKSGKRTRSIIQTHMHALILACSCCWLIRGAANLICKESLKHAETVHFFYRQYCFFDSLRPKKGLGTRRPHQYSCAIGS